MYVYRSKENPKHTVIAFTPPPEDMADRFTELVCSDDPKQVWDAIMPYCGTFAEKKSGEVSYTYADAAAMVGYIVFKTGDYKTQPDHETLSVIVKKHAGPGKRFVRDMYSDHLVDREVIGLYSVKLYDRGYADAIALSLCESSTEYDLDIDTLSRKPGEDGSVAYEVYVKG